jgi:hypothetical protein
MIPPMMAIAGIARASWVIWSLFAIAAGAARAQEAICKATAQTGAKTTGAALVYRGRVQDYRVTFQECRKGLNETRLAIRRMTVDGESLLLLVDPATLATSLDRGQCWTCTETDDEAQKDTRFIRAVESASRPAAGGAATQQAVFDAGLRHGATDGSFITGDLCPSRKPLDRGFLETLERMGPRTPVALAPSGLWLTRHRADFEWLRGEERSGALDITWVNHSYHHPYAPRLRPANNFLLTPGVNMQAEVLDTERLLIANGETPSIFFRFPGLISDAALVETVRRDHLVTLGADGWLVFAPPLRPGAILLVHPNGNEQEGLRLFSNLLNKGRLPLPFRPINEAP